MELARKEELKKYCNRFSNLVAVMDNNFRCAYSNKPKLLPQESSMMSLFQKTVMLPPDSVHFTMALLKGITYSVRIVPLDGELCLCEFFDRSTVFSMAENTDIYGMILPIVNGVEYNTAALWRGFYSLRSILEEQEDNDGIRSALGFEKYLTGLNSIMKNVSEYVNMLFYPANSKSVIDLAPILKGIVERCNTVLAESGRYIDFMCEPNEVYIKAEARHVMCAVVNALQNAVMYSPRDCIPNVSLFEPLNNKDNLIVLQIVNRNIMYVDQKHGEEPGRNFDHKRLGYGIPILKRFAEMAGGNLIFREENGQVVTTLQLPMIEKQVAENVSIPIKSPHYEYYKTEIPDILELKMQEVNELFRI